MTEASLIESPNDEIHDVVYSKLCYVNIDTKVSTPDMYDGICYFDGHPQPTTGEVIDGANRASAQAVSLALATDAVVLATAL